MNGWMEPPRPDGERAGDRALFEGLDLARRRFGDEIARRRVWSRVADVTPEGRPQRKRVGPFVLGGTLLLGAVTAALFLLRPRVDQTAPPPPTIAAVAPTIGQLTLRSPITPTTRDDARLVLGSGVHRTRPREKLRGMLRMGTRVDVEGNSELVVAERKAAVNKGAVNFDVPPQPVGERFTVGASAYRIVVLGTKFRVRVDGQNVGVDVDEGVVEIWRGPRRLRKILGGDRWSTPTAPFSRASHRRAPARAFAMTSPLQIEEPAEVVQGAIVATKVEAPDRFREVRQALAEHKPARAIAILAELSRGTGTVAQTASYELGRVYLETLRQPREAIEAWRRYRGRFPLGVLRAETDLSILDALVGLGQHGAALAEAQAFLARHPNNERRAEVTATATRLRALSEGGRPLEASAPSGR